jgi:hypothetical protein
MAHHVVLATMRGARRKRRDFAIFRITDMMMVQLTGLQAHWWQNVW